MAGYYRVARTLRTIAEPTRLQTAYEELQRIAAPNPGNVVELVEEFAKQLGNSYQSSAPSDSFALAAASKFLWMRFRNPVVVYDSVVSKWLWMNGGYRNNGYSGYYKCWLEKYSEFEQEIKQACEELIEIKKFTLACDASDEELKSWTTSPWFRERVFDHFMMAEIDVIGENNKRARFA